MATFQMRKQNNSTTLSVAVLLVLLSVTGCLNKQVTMPRVGTRKRMATAALVREVLVSAAGFRGMAAKRSGFRTPGLGEQAFTIAVPPNWKFRGLILRPHNATRPACPRMDFRIRYWLLTVTAMAGQLPGRLVDVEKRWHQLDAEVRADPDQIGYCVRWTLPYPTFTPFATNVMVVPPTPQMQQNLRNAQQQALQSSIAPTRNLVDTWPPGALNTRSGTSPWKRCSIR